MEEQKSSPDRGLSSTFPAGRPRDLRAEPSRVAVHVRVQEPCTLIARVENWGEGDELCLWSTACRRASAIHGYVWGKRHA